MSTNIDKSLILNKIKNEYECKTDAEFARFLDIPKTTLSSWYSRNRFDYELLYEKCEDINADFLLSGKGAVKSKSGWVLSEDQTSVYLTKADRRLAEQKIPLYEYHAAAGLVQLFGEHKNILDYIVIPNLPKSDGAIYVTGDSMYPLLKSGDIAIYKQINDMKEGIRFGEMHILSVLIDNDLSTVVKYVKKSEKGEDYIKLVSQNQHFADRDVHLKNVTAIALVKASIRLNTMM